MKGSWKWYLIGFLLLVGMESVIAGVYIASLVWRENADAGVNTRITTEDESAKEEAETETPVLTIPVAEVITVTCEKQEYQRYIVKPGDTLWQLAEQYRGCGKDYSLLAEWNEIENADLIYIGQLLTIPVDVTETIMQKDDWFYQNAIPIQPQGSFAVPVVMKNTLTGEITRVSEVPVTVKIRTEDLDFKRSGYQMVEALFETDTENISFSENILYYYFEVADRYTGVSFIQNSTRIMEMETYGVKVYELDIENPELGYEGTVDIVHSSNNNRITIQAEVPKAYDGLVFGFGEYIEVDREEFDSDKLYKINQFAIEDTEQYYFTADGY